MSELCTAAVTLAKATTDISASLVTSASLCPSSRQTTRKVSPEFLFTDPPYWSTMPCTISATWFTKVMTLPCRTSVAVLKFRMRALPMMQSTREPSIMASTWAELPPLMLFLTMFTPAWPKPSASSDPSLMIVFSRMTVSISSPFSVWKSLLHSDCPQPERFVSWACTFSSSSRLSSSSDIFRATSGSSRMASTLVIICSTGERTRACASFEKFSEATQSTMQTNTVLRMFLKASS
mmetsp:Transcript_75622/g.231448  ORF Transcript_75622/g.231448 Transcript_75622/m.231448 type:complete len:236 (+) Transcript_75622:756-1463(+)